VQARARYSTSMRLDSVFRCVRGTWGGLVGLTGRELVDYVHVELAAGCGLEGRGTQPPPMLCTAATGPAKHVHAGTEPGRLNWQRAPARPGLAQALGLLGVHGQDGAALESAPQQLHRVPPDALERAALHRVCRLLGVHARLPPAGPPRVDSLLLFFLEKRKGGLAAA